MPTRFKYTQVEPQSYALTASEILAATDAELNQYIPVKKYAPYRQDKKDGWDRTRTDRLKELKGAVSERTKVLFGDLADTSGAGEVRVKKRKGKKERMKEKEAVDSKPDEVAVAETMVVTREENVQPSKKRRRKHKKQVPLAS